MTQAYAGSDSRISSPPGFGSTQDGTGPEVDDSVLASPVDHGLEVFERDVTLAAEPEAAGFAMEIVSTEQSGFDATSGSTPCDVAGHYGSNADL